MAKQKQQSKKPVLTETRSSSSKTTSIRSSSKATKAKTTTSTTALRRRGDTSDGAFLLKMVIYVILGSLWIKLAPSGQAFHIPIPIGLIIGIAFTLNEKFRLDRKIEYAVLASAALFGFLAPYGLFIPL